jgi:hypothetical protein
VSITFTVTKKTGGDGFAHVGYINATGRDLGTVVIALVTRLTGSDFDSSAPTARMPSNDGQKRSASPPNKLFFAPFTDAVFQKETGSYSQALSPNYTPVLFHNPRGVGDSASRQTGKHSAQPQGANRNNKQHY